MAVPRRTMLALVASSLAGCGTLGDTPTPMSTDNPLAGDATQLGDLG